MPACPTKQGVHRQRTSATAAPMSHFALVGWHFQRHVHPLGSALFLTPSLVPKEPASNVLHAGGSEFFTDDYIVPPTRWWSQDSIPRDQTSEQSLKLQVKPCPAQSSGDMAGTDY